MSQSLPISTPWASPSRLRSAVPTAGSFSLSELLILMSAGAIAGAAVGMIELRLRTPGHSILHTILPMSLGLAAVPRRRSGTIMSGVAACVAAALMASGRGEFGAGAWTSLLSIGPALDLMLASRIGQRWPALSVAMAGLLANGCAFIAKALEKWNSLAAPLTGPGHGQGGGRGMGMGMGRGMGMGMGNGTGGGGGRGLGGGLGQGLGGGAGHGRDWDEWIRVAPISYLLCGLLAGLFCGVVLFHLRQKPNETLSGEPPQ